MLFYLTEVAVLVACGALETRAYDNEHHEYWQGSARAPKRAVLPELKLQIDAAIALTARVPHYFWTGQLPPFGGWADSVEPRARDAAMRAGAVTLDSTLDGINMPVWGEQDQDSQDAWIYASAAYANASVGIATVFRGEQVRPTNIFDTIVRIRRLGHQPSGHRYL
ncbi:hypothetical protein B0H16DRAFT_681656 [Mycena metata]|uniref:Uncharacterized protein n=1 Tax=Mycena metata TaxID=1033252 RepID=A0AAD7M9K3_9AGAR|nr:hypothetical protein B0H16DRAFT_681656 [Mycena metata]